MILEVLKKHNKTSFHGGSYTRITFKNEKGEWYRTDLVPTYRNYSQWKEVLKLGKGDMIRISDEAIKGELVDADYEPAVVKRKALQGSLVEDKQLSLL